VELWTQRATVAWPRSLGFFEHRIDILRQFENSGVLQQFNVDDDRVSVRLGDANHTLVYTSSHMELALLQPASEIGPAEAAAGVVLRALAPTRLLRPQFVFQWISPIAGDYDAARRDAAKRLFQGAGQSLWDFAVLADGRTTGEKEVVYRLECGIAEAAELPIRLSRHAGQLADNAFTSEEPTLWPRESLPDFGFFCDSVWTPQKKPDPSVEAFFHLWEDTKTAAEEVVSGFAEFLGIDEVSDE
jgi:hypothetical protein